MGHNYPECPTPNIAHGFVYNLTPVATYARAKQGASVTQHATFILPFFMNLLLSTVELRLCLQNRENKTEKAREKERKIKVKIIATITN